ncbi:MAG TPA: hypothetical protein VGE50_02135 [Gammaproteobacteria bacterium]
MLRAVAKIVAWLVGGLLGTAVLLYLLLLVVNLHDEPPSPAAQRFAEVRAKRPAVADENNAFIYLVGMGVDAQYDPQQAGLAMVAMERNRPPQEDSAGYTHPDYPQNDAIKISAKPLLDLLEACRTIGSSCLKFLDSKADTVTLGPPEQLLVERYRTLITFPEWRESGVTYNGPIPSYSPALNGQKLMLLDCWQLADDKAMNRCNGLLEADAHFWRNVFNSADSLITSMVAVRAMGNNLIWTNLIMRRDTKHPSRIAIPATWQRPISDDERAMERTWSGEWQFVESILSKVQSDGFGVLDGMQDKQTISAHMENWFMRPLFLHQATLNQQASSFVEVMEQYRTPYAQLPAVAAKRNASLPFGGEELSFPHMFYNPIGKILNEIGKPNYGGYMLKVADLEGARRALLATAALRTTHTPREKAAEMLTQLPLRNPYTNQPFAWDEATGCVLFEGLSETHNRYQFPL